MLETGNAVKVSIYLSEGSTDRGMATSAEVLDFLFFRGVSGATVLKGVAGFGADHHLHTSSIIAISDHLPIKIEFIETRAKVDEILGKLETLVGSGMIELQETMIVKPARKASKAPETIPHRKIEGQAKLMRIYVSEQDKWHDKPLHEALVQAMRANEISGVTVYKGILGYGGHRHVHKQKALTHDCSVMLSVIDSEQHINAFMPVLEQMLLDGMVVLSDVNIIKYSYGSASTEEQPKEV